VELGEKVRLIRLAQSLVVIKLASFSTSALNSFNIVRPAGIEPAPQAFSFSAAAFSKRGTWEARIMPLSCHTITFSVHALPSLPVRGKGWHLDHRRNS